MNRNGSRRTGSRVQGPVQPRWLAASLVLLFIAPTAIRAQTDAPILKPPKPSRPSASIEVSCDLACTWSLDGKPRGSIPAGGSFTAPLPLGAHTVSAVTSDNLDKLEKRFAVNSPGKFTLVLELQPVRDARLKAERDAAESRARYEKQAEDARTELEKAAAAQRAREAAEAHYQKGMDYLRWNSVSQAFPEFQQACDGGNSRGCFQLAYAYESGHGVSQDYSSARNFYRSSCDQDVLEACSNLGILVEHGEGGDKDLNLARSLYQKSCDGNNMFACTHLGILYDQALGVPQDLSQARLLYQKACDGSEMYACNNLAILYHYGKGVPVDTEKARTLYQRACDSGLAFACDNVKKLQ